jgi:CRP-like cAMP-binding protein
MRNLRLRGRNKKVNELATVALFDNVPRRVLDVIAANVDEVQVEPGQTLIEEGHRNDAFWIVMEGEAEMTIGDTKHRTIGPHHFFGATSMLDGKPAVATVVSKTPIRAYVASAQQFRALEGNEIIALRLLHYALERMREDLEAHTAPKPVARTSKARGAKSQ